MKKGILLGTLAVVALTACNNDENELSWGDKNLAAFTASIDGQTVTRAYDQVWEDGDKIGITGTSGDKAYTNVAYTTTGDGNFSVVTPGTEIYYQDNAQVAFTAYYPWNDLAGASSVTSNTCYQSDQKNFDFLHATGTGSKATPEVALTFAHKMAKVVLTLKKGTDVSYEELKSAVLTLKGFKNNGAFDVTTGEAAATGEAITDGWTFAGNATTTAYNAPYTTDDNAETVSYTFILFPQELAAALPFTATLKQTFSADIDFTSANSAAGDTDAKNQWVAGRQYNLSVTLHKTSLAVNGCTITAWQNAAGDNVDAW